MLPIVQVAYAVPDVRAAALRWHALTGAGPFFVREHVPTVRVEAGGEPAVFDHSCALGQWGEVMVEFVHHHALAPVALEAGMRRGGRGIHHVALFVADLDAERDRLTAAGVPLLMEAETPEVRFMFFDPGPEFGHLIECYERTPYLDRLYNRVAAAAVGWDGGEVLRER
jgi:catechol 2,3-dioxygenase-like lactoylglutathione lyase family enzyme